jgi:hypothetical protein
MLPRGAQNRARKGRTIDSGTLSFFVQTLVTFFLIGLIFFVQIVHYPLFAHVGTEHFRAYHRLHERQISWIVVPVMSTELVAASASLVYPGPLSPAQAGWGWGLVVVVWVCTAVVQIPQHRRLSAGFDARTQTRLVSLNWIRTFAWTARGVLLASVLAHLLA